MRTYILATFVFMILAAAVHADGLSDANAGMDALNLGDFGKAVTLFTRAITNGKLSSSDKELAYVKRAQAYFGEKNSNLALADLARAEQLDPSDGDVDRLRAEIKGKLGSQTQRPLNTPTSGWVSCSAEPTLRSLNELAPVDINFRNPTTEERELYWIDTNGSRVLRAIINAGEQYRVSTFLTNPWIVARPGGTCISAYFGEQGVSEVQLP